MGHEAERNKRQQDEHLPYEEASPGTTPGEESYGMTGEAGGQSIDEARAQDLSRQQPNEGGGAWSSAGQRRAEPPFDDAANEWSAQTLSEGSASGSQSYTAGGAEGNLATGGVGGGPGSGQREEPAHAGRTYTVEEGDTLQTIAARFYGSAAEYERIYRANEDRLHGSQHVEAGQEIVIPAPR